MKFKRTALKNGLTIITAPRKDAQTATVLVLVEAGSKYETKDINGISHFLEHMCFKGTKKRPRARLIAGELDAMGASYNAFTSQEYTGYYAKVDPTHITKALDVVSDIYLNQVFDAREIEKESGVIVEEINMYEDDPRRKIHDVFTSLLYQNQPAGWDIAGDKKTVQRLARKDFVSYRKKHYVAEATTVVIAGQFNEQKLLREVEKRFRSISEDKKEGKLKVIENQKKPVLSLTKKKSDQSHIILGFRAFPITDKRNTTLSVLSAILGSGMSSRLFSIIRDEMGAAYYVYSFSDLYTDHGYFAIAVGAGNDKVPNVISVIVRECKKLKEKAITQKELTKAKEYLTGKLAMSVETSDELALFYGMQNILKQDMRTPSRIASEVKKVTPKDIQKLAQEIFVQEGLNLAIIGPAQKASRFERLLKI